MPVPPASEIHELAGGELLAAVWSGVRDAKLPCRVFKNRMLRVGQVIRRPDLMACCRPAAHSLYEDDADAVAEVLSPSTKSIHVADKLAEYGQLRSIKEYLLIDPEARRAMLYQRHDLGWLLFDDPRADGVTFAGVRIDLDEIFDYVERTRTT